MRHWLRPASLAPRWRVEPMLSRSVHQTVGFRLVFALLLLAVSGSSARAAGSAAQVSSGPRNLKQVALTFDDGSSPANCRRILAELVTAGAPATFFPIAAAMDLDPAFWRLVADLGYPIGDHTLTHPQMPSLSYSAQVHQLAASRAIVESTIGRKMLNVFRPPYGAWNAATLRAAEATGFPTVITWDVSDRDTSPQGSLKEMLAAADRGTNGSVILMHCGPNATPYLLPSIIDHYRSLGFRFVTVPQLLGLPWSPGTMTTVAPDAILGSLTPLPAESKGGPVVGATGWVAPITSPAPTPAARTPKPSATPQPSNAASPAPGGASPSVSASPVGGPSSEAMELASPVAGPSHQDLRAVNGAAPGDASPALLIAAVAIAGAGVIVLLGLLATSRRRRGPSA